MSKWIIQSFLPTCKFCWGTKLNNCILVATANGVHPLFHFSPNFFFVKCWSKVWQHIVQLWRWWCKLLVFVLCHDSCLKDILHLYIWWRVEYKGLYFGNIMNRGTTFFIRKVWDASVRSGILAKMILWMGGNTHWILPCWGLSWFLDQVDTLLRIPLWENAQSIWCST